MKLTAGVTTLLLMVALLPGLPPYTDYPYIEIESTSLPPEFAAPNAALDEAERIPAAGPEGLALRDDGTLYVSTIDGVARLTPRNTLELVAEITPKCANPWEDNCGRPLGMRFSELDGKLLIADCTYGVWKLDVDTGKKQQLFDHRVAVDGAVGKFFNDVTEDSDGNIYYSVSSTIASLQEIAMEFIGGPSGRLVKFDPRSGKHTVLLDQVYLANGVELSPKEDFILVAENMAHRVLRYWLKGAKKGTHDMFVSGLPGSVDNIRANSQGGYDVPLVLIPQEDSVNIGAVLGRLPWLRRLLSRIVYGLKTALNFFSPKIRYTVMAALTNMDIMNGNRSMVIRTDANGNIVSKWQGNSGAVRLISEIKEVGDKYFIGSCCTNYLGVLTKKRLQDALKKKNNVHHSSSKNEKDEL